MAIRTVGLGSDYCHVTVNLYKLSIVNYIIIVIDILAVVKLSRVYEY